MTDDSVNGDPLEVTEMNFGNDFAAAPESLEALACTQYFTSTLPFISVDLSQHTQTNLVLPASHGLFPVVESGREGLRRTEHGLYAIDFQQFCDMACRRTLIVYNAIVHDSVSYPVDVDLCMAG